MNRIAVDIDEVLMAFAEPMAKWRGHKMPKGPHPYVYADMFNISKNESIKMVDEFYKSDAIKKVKPIPKSQKKLFEIRPKLKKIYAVTGRQVWARDITEEWLDDNFPNIFDEVVMTNSFTESEVSKVDICRSLAVDMIIDDNYTTCHLCNVNGIMAKHFIGYEGETYNWCPETNLSMLGWENFIL
jgi:hypothetical protein